MALLVNNSGTTRTKTAGTKLTSTELAAVEKFAAARGQSLGEFIRALIFREMGVAPSVPSTDLALREIVGVQLLLMNALKPLAIGQPLTAAAFDNIVAEVHKLKQTVARKLIQEEK